MTNPIEEHKDYCIQLEKKYGYTVIGTREDRVSAFLTKLTRQEFIQLIRTTKAKELFELRLTRTIPEVL